MHSTEQQKSWFSANISLYIGNDTRQSRSYYGMLIGNRTHAFEWYHFEWPWVTLSGLAKYSINDTKHRAICLRQLSLLFTHNCRRGVFTVLLILPKFWPEISSRLVQCPRVVLFDCSIASYTVSKTISHCISTLRAAILRDKCVCVCVCVCVCRRSAWYWYCRLSDSRRSTTVQSSYC